MDWGKSHLHTSHRKEFGDNSTPSASSCTRVLKLQGNWVINLAKDETRGQKKKNRE